MPSHAGPLVHDGDALTGTRERPGGGYEVTTIGVGRAGQDGAF